jgi:hypothetical protein
LAQEEDREWAKGLFGQMARDRVHMLHLIDRHSQQIEQFHEFMQETRTWQHEALVKLDRILDKLSDREN